MLLLQYLAIAFAIATIAGSVHALRKHRMSELQAALWITAGLLAGILGVFPQLIMWVADKLDVFWPPSLLLLFAIVSLGFIVFKQGQDIHELESKQTELTEHVSILKYELEKLQRAGEDKGE